MSPRPARPRRLQGRELPNITDEVGDLIPWGDRRTYKPSKEGNRFLGLCANPFWPFGAPVQRQLLYHFGTRRLTPWTPPTPHWSEFFSKGKGQRASGQTVTASRLKKARANSSGCRTLCPTNTRAHFLHPFQWGDSSGWMGSVDIVLVSRGAFRFSMIF